jgi:sugar (pentulose or hexulose) kinase
MLVNHCGEILAIGKKAIDPYFSEQPGWAEQHPACFENAIREACQQLWAVTDIDPATVAAVTLTTQRGTVVNVDVEGRPLRPAIIWLDQRRTPPADEMPVHWRVLFKTLKLEALVTTFREKAQINWIKANQPEIWDKTHKFLLLSGYLSWVLTGNFVDSVGAQVGYIPFDFRKQDWATGFDWKWSALEIRKDMLPDLVQPGSSLGVLCDRGAALLGLPEGIPVIAAAADKACEVMGSGGLGPETACLSYGTTATVNTVTSRYLEAVPMIPPYPAAIPGLWNTEIMIYRGFWMVSWFKEQFAHPEKSEAERLGIEPENLFDDLVNSVPPGSMGLMLQPYWSPGVREPGPEAKGAVIGFGDVHTRAHLYRAILEGLAYALREGKERIEKRSGTRIRRVIVSGGGSRSDAAMQLTADIFGMPVSRPDTHETSGLGAAICAFVGLGVYPDFSTAVNAMTRTGRVFNPTEAATALYDRLYRRVYLRMYRQLKPLYQEIRTITGYPA